MPLYEYLCKACGTRTSRVLPLARYKDPQYCHQQGCPEHVVFTPGMGLDEAEMPPKQVPMTKLLSAPAVRADYPGYVSPASGKWIEGKQAHLEDLKATGCRIFEPGERQQEIQKAKDREENLGKQIDQAVEQTAAQLGIGN